MGSPRARLQDSAFECGGYYIRQWWRRFWNSNARWFWEVGRSRLSVASVEFIEVIVLTQQMQMAPLVIHTVLIWGLFFSFMLSYLRSSSVCVETYAQDLTFPSWFSYNFHHLGYWPSKTYGGHVIHHPNIEFWNRITINNDHSTIASFWNGKTLWHLSSSFHL